jgi:hypothetical protein
MILDLFDSISILCPMKPGANVDPRIVHLAPFTEDDDRLSDFLKEYNPYTAINLNRASAFLKGRDGTPFVDPDSVPAIKAFLLKGSEAVEEKNLDDVNHADRLFKARVFLAMASDFDEKKQEIDRDMVSISRKEKALLDQLTGGDSLDELGVDIRLDFPGDDSVNTAIENRIAAWSELFVNASAIPGIRDCGFFLTTSELAVGVLLERIPKLLKLGTVDGVSSTNKDLSTVLRDLVLSEYSVDQAGYGDLSSHPDKPVLDIYLAPDVSPPTFFSNLAESRHDKPWEKSVFRNTVIGLFREG